MSLQTQLVLEKNLKDESELLQWTQSLQRILQPNSLVLISGGLAAGKTTMIRHLCAGYGIQMVQSPTYAIHQRYQNGQICIDHLDLYRLQSEDELASTGFWDLLQLKDNLVLIEWYEKISDFEWIKQEVKVRSVFGLKILVEKNHRNFKLYRLT